ncbi:MAG: hypothetical protein AB8D78_15635, partial [Akkermansiaceae bacterium]
MKIRFNGFVRLLSWSIVSLLLATPAMARTWKSADGSKTFEGELVSYDAKTGTVKVSISGVTGTFEESILSEADVAFLKQHATTPKGLAPALEPEPVVERPLEVPKKIEFLLEDHCWKCHDYGTQKGEIRLDNLAELPLDARLDLLNRAQEQTHFKQMPPKDEKTQPSPEERKELLAWIA